MLGPISPVPSFALMPCPISPVPSFVLSDIPSSLHEDGWRKGERVKGGSRGHEGEEEREGEDDRYGGRGRRRREEDVDGWKRRRVAGYEEDMGPR